MDSEKGATQLGVQLLKDWVPYHGMDHLRNSIRQQEGFIGPSVLIDFVRYGSEMAVQILLEKGADVNSRGYEGNTALHIVAGFYRYVGLSPGARVATCNVGLVRLLLAKGADIEAKRTKDGYTALMVAAQFGSDKVVRLLLEKGADITAKSFNGWTALKVARYFKRKAATRLLQDQSASWYKRLTQ